VKIREALCQASRALASVGIDEASLEAELLLMHTLGADRAYLYAQLDEQLSGEEAEAFDSLIARRLHHEPVAYITGRREFFGVDFYVDRRVLIPRPESELLVEKTLELMKGRSCLVADVGTGSGAIAISIALNLPQPKIYAIDISADALEVARINSSRYGVENRVHLLCGDMLSPLPEPVHLIVANLPYIKESDLSQLPAEIKTFEPLIALYGGNDGLDRIRELLAQARGKLLPGGYILLEIGEGQGEEVASLAGRHFPGARVELLKDLCGIDRVVMIET